MKSYIPILLFVILFVPLAVVGQLSANFIASPSSGCAPLFVQFTNTSTGNPVAYHWNLGNGSTVPTNNANPSTTYFSVGTYTVTLTVDGANGQSSTKTMTITVHDTPTVNFTASPINGCPPLTVQFTNTSTNTGGTGASYTWYINGTNSFTPNTSYIFNNGGNYDVSLVVTSAYGCTKTLTKTGFITVYDGPTIDFAADKTDLCSAPGTVIFTGSAIGVSPFTYGWQFGDGNNGSGNPISHTYTGPAPHTYNVELDVTDSRGCVTKLIKPNYITIHHNVPNFSAPASACARQPVTFTNTSSNPGATQTWDFGDGETSNNVSPIHNFLYDGTYTVTLITNENGCADSIKKIIVIHPVPTAVLTKVPDSACPAPIAITFAANGPNLTNYWWDFGDPNSLVTSTLSTPSHTYTEYGMYTVTAVLTNIYGCKDTIVKNDWVKIYDLDDTILATPTAGCAPLTVQFDQLGVSRHFPIPSIPPGYAYYPYGVKSYSLNFGDGSSNVSTQTAAHTYTSPGVYTVTGTIVTNNGCVAHDTILIRVGTKPQTSFLAPTRVCSREAVSLIDNTPPPTNHWEWNFGDSPVWDTVHQNPSHKYLPGIDTIKFVPYYNGCRGDTMYKVIVIDSPAAIFNAKMFCNHDSLKDVKFLNGSIGATTWTWYFGDGQTSTDWEPFHQYASFGSYTAMLVTYNAASGCRDTMVKPIDIISPTANLIANQTLFCPETTVTLTGSLSGGTATGYYWIITGAANAGANTFTSPIYTYTFHDAGYYNILLIITDQNNCQDSILKNNYLLADKPLPGFSAVPTIGCTPLTVLFTDTSTSLSGAKITNRVWNFGNATATTTNKTISNTYSLQGDYSVSLKVTDSLGCVDSINKPQFIHASKPAASFSTIAFGCAGTSVPFSNGSQRASKYFWDFGDGDTSNLFQPSHAYSAAGKYVVTLVAIDTLGCTDTFKMTPGLDVYKATASFTMSDSIAVCPPLSVHLMNTSPSGQTYLWNYGNGGKSNVNSPYVLYSSHGDFIVKLIATEIHGCKDTATGHIKILGFSGGFSYAPLSGCVPLTVSYYDTLANIPNAVWDFNDGYTQLINGPTATHTYTIPGTFIPRIIFTNGKGCTSFNNGNDEIHVDAAEAGFTWGPACEYQDVTFHDTSKSYFSSIVTRWWVFDDGTADVIPNPKHHYGAPGSYPVQLSVVNGNGCKDTIVKTVDVHALPDISAGQDTIICLHDSATLVPSGGISYIWLPASYLDCSTCNNPHAAPPAKFSYIVTGTDANGCTNQDTVTVNIKNKVVATMGPGGEVCDNESVQLEVSGGKSYRWTPSDGLDNDTSATPIATPHGTVTYIVIAYEGSCIPDTGTAKVIIHPLPKVTARGEQTIIAGSTADIQASGERIVRYEWSPAATLSCANCPAPTAKPSQTTTYTIKVYSDFGCVDSDNVTIHVLCDKSQLFIPNTFTPNGDGQNDVFYPRGTGLTTVKSFRIYDRWGEKVFERSGFNLNDEANGWNGEFKGQVLKPDVFVYIIEVYCDNGEILSFKGDVTIIR